MLAFRLQLLGNLIVGALAGWLLSFAMRTPGVEIEVKKQPFVTHYEMLMVTLELFREAPPQIKSIEPLEEGRVSVTLPGEYKLSLLDADGNELYSLSFGVVFMRAGDPPKLYDQVRVTFVLPYSKDAASVRVEGPTGIAEARIPENE